jgi:hypothetical protein
MQRRLFLYSPPQLSHMRTKTVFAVVTLFLVISISPILLSSYDSVDGFGNSDTIAISSAEELALIGNDERYPLDGNYVQTGNIDFGGKDLNSGFILVVNATLQGTTLSIDLLRENGSPITSELDILVSVNGIIKVIGAGSSSVSFDVPSTGTLTVNIIAGGMAELPSLGMNPYFSVAKSFDVEDSKTVSMSFNSNGNMDPIGSDSGPFIGTYDGNGYKITGLQTATYSTGYNAYSGLFGNVGIFAVFNDIDLEISSSAVSQYLNAYAGGLVGYVSNRNINITNCHVTGYVAGEAAPPTSYAGAYSGGLVGYVEGNLNVINCYNEVDVSSVSSTYSYSGGLAGGVNGNVTVFDTNNTGTILSISDDVLSGGLIGSAINITALRSSVKGDILSISSQSAVSGGFVGSATKFVTVSESYVIGNVSASALDPSDAANLYSGGFIGNAVDLSITDCYVIGNMSSSGSSSNVLSGGLAGYVSKSVNLTNSYVIGKITITGTGCKGGIGNFEDSNNYITNCYFLKTATINTDLDLYGTGTVTVDGMSSGTRSEDPSGGYNDNELKTQDTFYEGTTSIRSKQIDGWDFTGIWYIDASASINDGYPIIRSSLAVTDLKDTYVRIGDTITFVANANDRVTDYQWQIYDDNHMTWADIPGETGKTYSLRGITQDDIRKIYRCEVKTLVNDVEIATKTSGIGQILLKDDTYHLEISNIEELSKVGSDEIVNGMIFRPNGNYVQTKDLEFSDTDDLNGGFDMVVNAILDDTKLTISLHYGDATETPILSTYRMSVSVNGVADAIIVGESSVTFTVPAGITDLDITAGGNADNIPDTMDKDHPNFTIHVLLTLNGGSTKSDSINSNGNIDPIGSTIKPFDGTYNGKGYKIAGLRTMVFSTTDAYSALFGHARMIALKGVYLEDNLSMGSSIAFSEDLDAAYDWDLNDADPPHELDPSSSIAFSGGLVGYSGGIVTIDDCYTTGDVRSLASAFSGGLVGLVEGHIFITDSYTTGNVLSLYTVAFSGGLIGIVGGYAVISNSYNKGDVSAQSIFASFSGGLIGVAGVDTIINNSYVAGDVSSSALVAFSGGLVGMMNGSSTISNSYVIGDITTTLSTGVLSFSGGIAGLFQADAFIVNCYVKGEIIAASESIKSEGGIGNMTGLNNYITNCHYLKTYTINVDMDYYGYGHAVINGGIMGRDDTGGLTLEELQDKDSYETAMTIIGGEEVKGWDFVDIWCIDQDSSSSAEQRANNGLPFLRSLAISKQPQDIFTDDPVGNEFSVALQTVPAKYQWQKSTDGENWEDIDGETGSTYVTTADDDINDLFRCVICYGNESIYSQPVRLLQEYDVILDYDTDKGTVQLSTDKATVKDVVTIIISPKKGYEGKVTTNVGSLSKISDTEYRLSGITENCIVKIEFDLEIYSVRTDHDDSRGEVKLSTNRTTVEGTVTITVTSNEGYILRYVNSSNGTLTHSGDHIFVLTNVTANCIVIVVFDPEVYAVTADYDREKGDVRLSVNKVTVEDIVSVIIIPGEGYSTGVVTADVGLLAKISDIEYGLTGVTRDCTVSVEFNAVPEPVPPGDDDTMLYVIVGAIVIISLFGMIGAIWFFRFRV